MAIDPGLERIFESWFDYDHSTDEDAKYHHGQVRSGLIKAAMQKSKPAVHGTVADFLHVYRDRYREWVIRKKGGTIRKRF